MLPFNGRCHVAYIPDGKVLGLSKIARIVDMFARRLQIQERLTHQVAEAITEITGCKGCAVVVEAQHMCMVMRGVQKQNSVMKTSSMVGAFRNNPSTRAEFLALLKS
jgi:GTP cyclohydrolase I